MATRRAHSPHRLPQQELPAEEERLLTLGQVVEVVGGTIDAVRKQLQLGHIPGGLKLGRQWRVKRSVLQQWLREMPTD